MEYQIKYTEFLSRARNTLYEQYIDIAYLALSVGLEEDITKEKINKCHSFLNFVKAIQSPFLVWTNKEVEIGIDYWMDVYNMYNQNLLLSPSDEFTKIIKEVVEGSVTVALPEFGFGSLTKDSNGNIYWQEESNTIDLGEL